MHVHVRVYNEKTIDLIFTKPITNQSTAQWGNIKCLIL